MGQKIHPIGFRLAVQKNWTSKWYSNTKNFAGMLLEDIKVRDYLKKKLSQAAVGKIVIERPAKNAKITIYRRALVSSSVKKVRILRNSAAPCKS
jgi:small subunit ribosomal protein S3